MSDVSSRQQMLKELTRSLVPQQDATTTTVIECRRCGYTVSSTDCSCPACGGEAMVEYTID